MSYLMNTVIHKSSDKYFATEKELERIRAISDEKIDFSDAPETDAEFWTTAKFSQDVESKKPSILR